jgi:hypothetical protein
MQRKFSFSGTPADVDSVVRRIRDDYTSRRDTAPVNMRFTSVRPDALRVEVLLYKQHRVVRGAAPPKWRTITADRVSKRRTQIAFDIPDEEWEALQPSWERLASELRRIGTLEEWTDELPANAEHEVQP